MQFNKANFNFAQHILDIKTPIPQRENNKYILHRKWNPILNRWERFYIESLSAQILQMNGTYTYLQLPIL